MSLALTFFFHQYEQILSRIFVVPENYTEIYFMELLMLVKHGGFTRQDVRNMPIFERKYYLKILNENINKE